MPEQFGFRCMIPEPETYTTVASVTMSVVDGGAVEGAAVNVGISVGVSTGVAVGKGVAVGADVAVGTGVTVEVGLPVAVGAAVGAGVGVEDGICSVGVGTGVGAGVSAPCFDSESPPRSNPAATVRTDTPSKRRLSHAAFGSQSSDTMSAAAPRTQTNPPSTVRSPFLHHFSTLYQFAAAFAIPTCFFIPFVLYFIYKMCI